MRLARKVRLDRAATYHLFARTVGCLGDRPLADPDAAAYLTVLCRRYTGAYRCQLAAFQILGNHFHLAVRFEAYRPLNRNELMQCIPRYYPGRYQPWRRWTDLQWARFNRRLFHPSELMRNLLQAFATWSNRRLGRRGAVWAGRHGSVVSDHLRETVFYVELNAVRLGLAARPEDWVWGSARLRWAGTDNWLMPLEELLGAPTREQAERAYWQGLYGRGTRPSKPADHTLPFAWVEEMTAGLRQAQLERGAYLYRVPALSQGRAVGSWALVAERLAHHRADPGVLVTRTAPVPVGVGGLYTMCMPRRPAPHPNGYG